MAIVTILFYMFSAWLLFAGLMAVTSKTMVQAVLFLILSFFNAAGLFILLQAEFLAMMLVVVYVGAVAVLFLFVVMMLDKASEKPAETLKRAPYLSYIVGGVIVVEMLLTMMYWGELQVATHLTSLPISQATTNTHAIGQVLYTNYGFPFQLAGLILLVAMIGAIVLSLRERQGVRRQNIYDQLQRDARESVTLVDAPLGRGLSQ